MPRDKIKLVSSAGTGHYYTTDYFFYVILLIFQYLFQ